MVTPVASLLSAPGSSSAASSSPDSNQLSGNFNEFLKLLTTQLQHQDPLSPLDANQFTQELVQFSSVEQQIQTNDSLKTLISLQQNAQLTSALAFLGHTVTVNGSVAQLTNGTAGWSYNAGKPGVAAINISDSTGKLVYSTKQPIDAGQQTFTWDGTTTNGNRLTSGTFSISITATDANGQPISVATQTQGKVSGVDVSVSPPALIVNGQSYPLSQILEIVS